MNWKSEMIETKYLKTCENDQSDRYLTQTNDNKRRKYQGKQ